MICSLSIFRFRLSILLLFVVACQPSTTSESIIAPLETEHSATTDSLEGKSLSQITLLAQQVQQVRQLQEHFRKDLDSLYTVDGVQSQTDTLENIYFMLTDAETAWIVLRTQYPSEFDSTGLTSDTVPTPDFESSLETVQQALSSSINRAERWRTTQPK